MNSTILTEEEFVALLETGKAPAWFENYEIASPDAVSERRGSHNDLIDVDYLAKEFVLRELGALFGKRRIPKKYQAGLTYSVLELAEVQGLVVEQEPIGKMRSFVSTERMAKYWSKMFAGEPLPIPDKADLC